MMNIGWPLGTSVCETQRNAIVWRYSWPTVDRRRHPLPCEQLDQWDQLDIWRCLTYDDNIGKQSPLTSASQRLYPSPSPSGADIWSYVTPQRITLTFEWLNFMCSVSMETVPFMSVLTSCEEKPESLIAKAHIKLWLRSTASRAS